MGEFTDTKLLAAAFAISLVALAGLAFAFPGWHKGIGNQNATWRNATWNNSTWHGRGPWTNNTQPDATVGGQFVQALQSDDYATAKQLHDTYGFGGVMFDKLNETTFAKYSQIYNLQSELRQELGFKGKNIFGPMPEGFRDGYEFGFARGMQYRIRNASPRPPTA